MIMWYMFHILWRNVKHVILSYVVHISHICLPWNV